jgi:hypothetical protein
VFIVLLYVFVAEIAPLPLLLLAVHSCSRVFPFGFLTLYSLSLVACLATKMSRGQSAVQRSDAACLLLQRPPVLELNLFSCQQGTSRARCPALTACTRPMFCSVWWLVSLFVILVRRDLMRANTSLLAPLFSCPSDDSLSPPSPPCSHAACHRSSCARRPRTHGHDLASLRSIVFWCDPWHPPNTS